ncbi:hypothetical protein ACGGZK_16510 [Agromyces sp. MMS24-K17]|uniref:hypothetical protein n=1 Tax=Agromyces sp. MMS24-K17 TaxID=3372850 RepID=UPI0037541E9E
MSDRDWTPPSAEPPSAAEPSLPATPPAPVPPPAPPRYQPDPTVPPPGYPAPSAYAPAGAYAQAGNAAPVAPAGAYPQAGWAPPPKPGLLPLRPLGFGTLLWAPFQVLRRNPAPTFGSGLLVQLASAGVTLAIVLPFLFLVFGRVESATSADADPILAGAVGGFLLLLLVPIALTLVAAAFLQGVMVVEVASGTLGDKLRFGQLWRRAAKRIWPLLGWTAMVAAAVVVVVVALVAGVALGIGLASSVFGAGGIVAVVLLGVLAGLVVAAASVWLSVKLSLVPSAIVLEDLGVGRAIARSWRLTDGYFWRTFGVEALVQVILSFASQIISQPIGLIGGLLIGLLDPTGSSGAAVALTIGLVVVSTIVSVLVGAITSVVQAGLIAVIYIDLRMRKEGLDLDLERHVEQCARGVAVGDPYLPAGSAPAGAAAWPA